MKAILGVVVLMLLPGCGGIQLARGPIPLNANTPAYTVAGRPLPAAIDHRECADFYKTSVTAHGNRELALAANCSSGGSSD